MKSKRIDQDMVVVVFHLYVVRNVSTIQHLEFCTPSKNTIVVQVQKSNLFTANTLQLQSAPSSFRMSIDQRMNTMSNQITTPSFFSSWATPFYGLLRTANEAAKLGEDCTNKVFVVTGAYSGIGM